MQPRRSAQESAIRFLDVLQGNTGINWLSSQRSAEQAFEMVERELAGYLSNPESPYKNMFNAIRFKLFPGGLRENIRPGHDLLISTRAISNRFPQFKNIEYAIRNILGNKLALDMFSLRGVILKKLSEFDGNWKTNLDKNTEAMAHVKTLRISEITASRWGLLSCFYYVYPYEYDKHKYSSDTRIHTRSMT